MGINLETEPIITSLNMTGQKNEVGFSLNDKQTNQLKRES